MSHFLHVIAADAGLALFFAAQVVGLLLIPIGIPGTFVQVLAAAILAAVTNGSSMGLKWVGIFLLLALFGEAIDILSGRWGAKRFGGSASAAWGALLGGLVGAPVGQTVVPVPLVGAIFGSFIGTFAGAICGQMHSQRKLEPNLRVGIGAMIGRAIGIGIKLCIAVAILILSILVVCK